MFGSFWRTLKIKQFIRFSYIEKLTKKLRFPVYEVNKNATCLKLASMTGQYSYTTIDVDPH